MESKDLLGKGWIYSGDVNAFGYGGKWIRQVYGLAFQIVELTNMDNACGRDNEGRDRYVVELSLVDLTDVSPETIGHALGFVGAPTDELIPHAEIAEACHAYGAKAPLESWQGNNGHKLLRAARAMANELRKDEAATAERMERPVNAIGSTAREFMMGDLDSALTRGVASGNPDALILKKMDDAATIACPACAGEGVSLYSAAPSLTCGTCEGTGKVVRTLGGHRPASE